MPRVVTAVAAVLLASAAFVGRAEAKPTVGASTDDTGVTATAGNGSGGPGSTGSGVVPVSTSSGGGGRAQCTGFVDDGRGGELTGSGDVWYRPVTDEVNAGLERMEPHSVPGRWYLKLCGAGYFVGPVWFPAGSEPPISPVDPALLAEQAKRRLDLPAPVIGMSPAADVPQLVGLATFLWVPGSWSPRSESASVGSITSTVTAVPARVIWDMGQGDTLVCEGPGSPYIAGLSDDRQPSSCRFTYPSSSARSPSRTFTVTATVEWKTTWEAAGAPGGGDLGTIRRSSTTAVRVAELQALNVNPRS